MNIGDLEKAVARFFKAQFPAWSVVRGLQNQPKPSNKIISYYIERFRKVGEDTWISASNIDTTTDHLGVRDVWLSVMITGEDALQVGWDFNNIIDSAEIAEFAHIDSDTPTQIAYMQGTKYIERCEFPWRIRTSSEYTLDLGRIENGTITGDIEGIATTIDFQK